MGNTTKNRRDRSPAIHGPRPANFRSSQVTGPLAAAVLGRPQERRVKVPQGLGTWSKHVAGAFARHGIDTLTGPANFGASLLASRGAPLTVGIAASDRACQS